MNNGKVQRNLIIAFIIFLIGVLWISGLIPQQIAKIASKQYFQKHYPEKGLEYVDIEWSPSHGSYIVYFQQPDNQRYGFVIGPKYFPVSIGQGLTALDD